MRADMWSGISCNFLVVPLSTVVSIHLRMLGGFAAYIVIFTCAPLIHLVPFLTKPVAFALTIALVVLSGTCRSSDWPWDACSQFR
jgi:hypothetical protein